MIRLLATRSACKLAFKRATAQQGKAWLFTAWDAVIRDAFLALLKQRADAMENLTETNVRRHAARKGYVLRKSRCRTPQDPRYRRSMLINPKTNCVVFGAQPWAFCALKT
jgi:hypothetical protein